MEALAESGRRVRGSGGVVGSRGCAGREVQQLQARAGRLRGQGGGLESQLSSVEAHIADAAKDFEVLRRS